MNDHATFRRHVYFVLIVCSVANLVGRIWTVQSSWTGRPGYVGSAMLSANDRSRWCTVRSLVEHGTYAIDAVILNDDGSRNREWYTIDMVRHRGPDGRQHYYSSKPPLFPTLLAGQYWLIRAFTGASLEHNPHYVQRLMLLTTNVLPLLIYFFLLAGMVERLGRTDWGRVFVVAAATWGTFLTTFGVTINNHLPAAISVFIASFAVLKILRDGDQRLGYFALAGGFAAFAVANELPALSFLALLGGILLWQAPRKTCLAFVPAAALVAAGFFGTNYLAHQDWRPPYVHRGDGRVLAVLSAGLGEDGAPRLKPVIDELVDRGIRVSNTASITASDKTGRWVLWDPEQELRFALLRRSTDLEVRAWDNWYEYEGTYWTDTKKTGVDRGEASKAVYTFHSLLGHRGIISLTPIWLFTMSGIGMWLRSRDTTLRGLASVVLILTVVCLAFYLNRPQVDRNYGGVAAGFRWLFWFIPLWLLCLVPAADVLARHRWLRAVGWLLLFISVVSASYASLNPWTHSWIFHYWTEMRWIQY